MAKVSSRYVPDRGDVIVINFTPQSGIEQSGERPALVLTGKSFNSSSGLVFACPITRTRRNEILEIDMPNSSNVNGVALIAHTRSVDWSSRGARLVGRVPMALLDDAGNILKAILQIE